MSLEHAILGFLADGPMTGYDLKTRRFDTTASHVWTADQAQIYRTLDRMVRKRLATARAVAQRGRPDRRVYTITPRGREELRSWLESEAEVTVRRDPFLLRLMFASELDDASLLDLLSETRAANMDRLESLRSRIAESPRDTREGAIRRMTLEASAADVRAQVDWLDASMDRVRSGLPAAAARAEGGTSR